MVWRIPYGSLALLLAFFSFSMSAIISRTAFERLPHLEDELAYLFQARTYAGGQLTVPTPEPRRAFWQPFIIDHDGARFSKYTPGWPLALMWGVWMGQPWLINALLAALTVTLTYRLGREVFGADAGLIAAALTAFSPMALLLNASLMGHTAALCAVTLFLYGYWRLERGRGAFAWGLVAGAGLGFALAARPLTAVAVALPFVVYSLLRLLEPLRGRALSVVWHRLKPLLALTAVTLGFGLTVPLYNLAATGDPTANLYTFIWPYDRLGFGEAGVYGRNGHTIEKGLRHVRFDLSLTAADLFGWQAGPITPALQDHLRTQSDYWPVLGLSWVLLPFGLAAGLRGLRFAAAAAWIALGGGVVAWTLAQPPELLQDVAFSWAWVLAALIWTLLPVAALYVSRADARARWTWLLLAVALCLIIAQLAYWIGSQRYSTRYFFEGLSGIALGSALGLAWAARRGFRPLIYGALIAALLYSLTAYSLPRIGALYRFNQISPDPIAGALARQVDDRPLLVIVSGRDVRWRAAGALMSVTSPYLDSEIVVALDNGEPGVRAAILARFPDRQVIEMVGVGDVAAFLD